MQMDWLDSKLDDDTGNKYIIATHIYAGGRFKHDNTFKEQTLWTKNYNDKYFEMVKKHRDRIVIELAGHDHWEDLRMLYDKDGSEYRNLFIGNGVTPNFGQMPGFNTMKIDGQNMKPKELMQTILNIRPSWGNSTMPPLIDLPHTMIDYAKDYDFTDLTAESIYDRLHKFEFGNTRETVNYLSNKIGYNPNSNELDSGEARVESWSLLTKDHANADTYYC